ncbi:MAG: DUF2062 domain-containing protein [Rhodobacteraceae bacterium]|nr:DUF2062 domain-containing protein [Paracoccaceae bacterium]
MVFKRRKKLHWLQTVRSYVMPRTGWKRAISYMGHRLKRLPDSATRIARGISFGVFVSFSPFFGLHFLYVFILARMFGGNFIAAAAGTFFGNPLTFPFIIGFSLKVGNWVLGRDPAQHDFKKIGAAFREFFHTIWASFKSLFGAPPPQTDGLHDFFSEILLPYFIGGTILGIIFAIPAFYLAKPLIIAYQKHRLKKRLEKRKRHTTEAEDQPSEG